MLRQTQNHQQPIIRAPAAALSRPEGLLHSWGEPRTRGTLGRRDFSFSRSHIFPPTRRSSLTSGPQPRTKGAEGVEGSRILTWAVQLLMFIYNSSFTSPRKSQRQLAHTREVRRPGRLPKQAGITGWLRGHTQGLQFLISPGCQLNSD